jgi:SAM-dependent methyltransferase
MDWQSWYDRWERMQAAYVPDREHRFELMFRIVDLIRAQQVTVLDLGCGPGSLGLRVLEVNPRARVVGVDVDPVLLEMGRQIAGPRLGSITFREADLRDGDWWDEYRGAFDLVLTMTALHWLSPANLRHTHARIFAALKPGGWVLNSDHMSSDFPDSLAHHRMIMRDKQQAAFARTSADTWDEFWKGLAREPELAELLARRNEKALWEGDDDGLPRSFHRQSLTAAGFDRIEFHWQELGDAILGARKPEEKDEG